MLFHSLLHQPRPLARPYRAAPGHGGEKFPRAESLASCSNIWVREREETGGQQGALGSLQSSLWARWVDLPPEGHFVHRIVQGALKPDPRRPSLGTQLGRMRATPRPWRTEGFGDVGYEKQPNLSISQVWSGLSRPRECTQHPSRSQEVLGALLPGLGSVRVRDGNRRWKKIRTRSKTKQNKTKKQNNTKEVPKAGEIHKY